MPSARTTFTAATFAVALAATAVGGTTAAAATSDGERAIGAATLMSRMPSTADGVIKGRSGDLVFGGMQGQTVTGLWAAANHQHIHGFLLYLPKVECSDGFAADLRRTLEIRPANERQTRSGFLTGDKVGAGGRIKASGLSVIAYSTPSGDVSGVLDEEVTGSVVGYRASGHYTARVVLTDENDATFATCSIRVPWSAQEGTKRHFIGGTWQNPMYLERSQNGKRVERIRIATSLGCDDGATWQGYMGFSGIPVRHNRFTLESDSTEPWDVGQLHDVTTGFGTFHGSVARGSFGEDATTTGPTGETTAHCAQAAFPWSADSSAH